MRTETEKERSGGRQSESKRREDMKEEKVGGMASVRFSVCVHLFLKVRSHKDELDSLILKEVERRRRQVHTCTYVHIHMCTCRQISSHTHNLQKPNNAEFTFLF